MAQQPPSLDALRAACEAAGQSHLLESWDALLTDAERDALARDVAGLDFPFLKKALAGSLAAENDGAVAGKGAGPPPPGAVLRLSDATPEQRAAWRSAGLRMYAEGRAAVLLLAGGQGTRLGSALPKGCFDVGLPSRKPLYALQAERLLALQRLAAAEAGGNNTKNTKPIRWFVMTSPATHADTLAAFERAAFWGLRPEQVVFFQQGTLPCLTPEGRVILERAGAVARAPDGNGGLYAALLRSGGAEVGGGGGKSNSTSTNPSVLELMVQLGIEALDCYCVDNAAARVGDPEFLGYCHGKGAGMGARVVAKASADERVGVFAATAAEGGGSASGRLRVLEYSELDPSLASAAGPHADEPDGDPYLFNWANVCMHYFSVAWLKQAAERLVAQPVYHVARKMIPSFSSDGGGIVKVSGIKLEQFIFDPLPWASEAPGVALFEVDRRSHFAPVKNAEGADSPATARAAVLAQGAAWVRAAGGVVEEGAGVEVSPLVSYAGEGLEARVKGKTFADGDVIEA